MVSSSFQGLSNQLLLRLSRGTKRSCRLHVAIGLPVEMMGFLLLLILTSVRIRVLLGLVRCLTISETRIDDETLACAEGFLGHSKVCLSGVTWTLLIFRIYVLPGCVEIEVLASIIADSRNHRVSLPGPSVCLPGDHSICLSNGNVLRMVSVDSCLAGWPLSETELLGWVIAATLGESALSVYVGHIVIKFSFMFFQWPDFDSLDYFKRPFD